MSEGIDDTNNGPIFDEPLPVAAFFIEVMAHADKLEADDPGGRGHHEASRLRGLAGVFQTTFCLIAEELRYEFASAVQEDEDAGIPMFVLMALDTIDAIDGWPELHGVRDDADHAAAVQAAMSEMNIEYLDDGIPTKPIPPGRWVVHNQVHLPPRLRTHGSRAWIQDADADRLEVCDCGWAPELAEHYRVRGTDT